MHKPPITLFYPSYVVQYAVVDSTVIYMDRKTLNGDGEWLGPVPNLAICSDINTSKFHLLHCNGDWESLCAVETAETIEGIKNIAEKHYKGIRAKWISTEYTEAEAVKTFEKEKEKIKCSFCGKSHYDEGVTMVVSGDNAKICNLCIKSFSAESLNEKS